MPFTPELHKLVKNELNHNVTMIKKLFNNEGTKLAFNVTTGKFSIQKFALIRTMGNFFKSGESDSATSQNLFEFPLLITFYELRKLELNINGKVKQAKESNPYRYRLFGNGTPYEAFNEVEKALKYLKENTYKADKEIQRQAIDAVLSNATMLKNSTTQPQLDRHLAEWIPFVIPEDIKNMVIKSHQLMIEFATLTDSKYKKTYAIIKSNIPESGWEKTASEWMINRIDTLKSIIYKYVYNANSFNKNDVYEKSQEMQYAKEILKAIQPPITTYISKAFWMQPGYEPRYQVRATLENFINGQAYETIVKDNIKNDICRDTIGFMFFFNGYWRSEGGARVYIHFKYEINGASAVKGLVKILSYLSGLSRSEEGRIIIGNFSNFKISDLRMLRTRNDSIVMYCKNVETAKSIANGLKEPLKDLVAGTLPPSVRLIAPGIGYATEPEPSYHKEFRPIAPLYNPIAPLGSDDKYSYGSHRCALIAKGLLNASGADLNFILPDINTCLKFVALAFSDAGVEFFKPHHMGSLPPLPPLLS